MLSDNIASLGLINKCEKVKCFGKMVLQSTGEGRCGPCNMLGDEERSLKWLGRVEFEA
jgi:hypothetical protein